MATHLMRTTGTVAIVREGTETPLDKEWDESLKQLHQVDAQRLRFLIRTDGGGPTGPQRNRLKETLGSNPVKVAVVTDSAKVRFIVSSIALFSRDIRTFPVSELFEAFNYLGFTPTERKMAEQALDEMDRQLAR